MPKTYNQSCNIAKTLEHVGDRWTLLIVRDLLAGINKFNDLKTSLAGISTNILSDRLQALETDGLVTSSLYSSHPPRYEYNLTPSGRDLRFVLGALGIWGNKHFAETYVEIIHPECSHELESAYYCPHCDELVREAKYKSVEKSNYP